MIGTLRGNGWVCGVICGWYLDVAVQIVSKIPRYRLVALKSKRWSMDLQCTYHAACILSHWCSRRELTHTFHLLVLLHSLYCPYSGHGNSMRDLGIDKAKFSLSEDLPRPLS